MSFSQRPGAAAANPEKGYNFAKQRMKMSNPSPPNPATVDANIRRRPTLGVVQDSIAKNQINRTGAVAFFFIFFFVMISSNKCGLHDAAG